MRPLESTIQIFFKHSSLACPSFSMAIVINSAIPIAAWQEDRTEEEKVWQVMWWWWNRASFLQSVYQIVSFMSLSLLTEENVMKQYEIQCAIILYSCPQWPLSSRSNCAIHTSPAPWNTMVWSNILLLVMRRAAKSPATATAAVPDGDDRTSDKR